MAENKIRFVREIVSLLYATGRIEQGAQAWFNLQHEEGCISERDNRLCDCSVIVKDLYSFRHGCWN